MLKRLVFRSLILAVCAGCGGSGSTDPAGGGGGGGGTPPPDGGSTLKRPVLFVVNGGNSTVAAFESPARLSGDTAPAAILGGSRTDLSKPFGLALTQAGDLVVRDGNRLLRYADPLHGLGNRAPDGIVTGSRTGVGGAGGIATSRVSDTLFVGEGSTIAAFDGASTAAFNGDIAPTRAFGSAFNLFSASAMVANSRDTLFVVDTSGETAWALDGATTANGNIDRPRVIDAEFPTGIALDGDVLFVIDSEGGPSTIIAYDVRGGDERFSHFVRIAGSTHISGLAIDSAGTAYLSDPTLSVIYVVKNFASRHDAIEPDAVIGGNATGLSRPGGLVLVE